MEQALIKSLGADAILINFKTIGGNTIYGKCEPTKTTIKIMYDALRNNYDIEHIDPIYLQINLFDETTNQEIVFDETIDMTLTDYMKSKGVCLEKNVYNFTIVDKRAYLNLRLGNYEDEIKQFKNNYGNTKTQMFCRLLTGKIITLPYEPYMTIGEVKIGVMIQTGIPVTQQRLIFRSRLLDNASCASYNIIANSTLELILSLRGGMYHETSGRNGGYRPLQDIFFSF